MTSVDLLLLSKSYICTILFIHLETSFYAVPSLTLFPLQAWRKKMSQEKAAGENSHC